MIRCRKSLLIYLIFILSILIFFIIFMQLQKNIIDTNNTDNDIIKLSPMANPIWRFVEDEHFGTVIINDNGNSIITNAGRFDHNGDWITLDLYEYYLELSTYTTVYRVRLTAFYEGPATFASLSYPYEDMDIRLKFSPIPEGMIGSINFISRYSQGLENGTFVQIVR